MLDLLIVLAFIVYAVSNGLLARRKASRGLDDYFLAGRSVRGWRAGTSMAATQFAADTPLLVTGLVATGGIFLVWRLWIYGIAFLLMAFVLSALWRRARVLTDAELTEIRYSGGAVLPLRVLKAVYYGTIINCVVMAMVLVAAVRIAEVFLPWHLWLPESVFGPLVSMVGGLGITLASGETGIPADVATTNNLISIGAILAFTAMYSMTGGLRSVIATDVMQFGLAMVGTAAFAWIVVSAAGGLGGLTDSVVELYGHARAAELLSFTPTGGELLIPFLILIGMQWFFQMNSDGTGYLAQRSMACETDRDARVAGVTFAWLQIFARSLLWLLIAAGLLVIYPFGAGGSEGEAFVAARELTFVRGIDELLPVGIRGLMLTGLLAALASTIDTHLNWGASYWSNDVYRRLVCDHWLDRRASPRELVVVARLSNVLILVIALAIMANLGSIQTAWFISLLFGAGMGAVLVLRWLWERINVYSELAAMATSLVVAPILLVATNEEWIRIGVMALASTGAAVAAALLAPRTDPERLRSFYLRVRPAGFWGRTAGRVGETPAVPRRRLWHGVQATGVCALSLFLMLLGVGRLLVPAPDASATVSLVLVAGGLVLVPVWIRATIREPVAERAPETAPVRSHASAT